MDEEICPLKEEHGVVVIRVSINGFISKMYKTFFLTFLLTVAGTVAFFVQTNGLQDLSRYKQVFAIVAPLYVLALLLLHQFRGFFPSNLLLVSSERRALFVCLLACYHY